MKTKESTGALFLCLVALSSWVIACPGGGQETPGGSGPSSSAGASGSSDTSGGGGSNGGSASTATTPGGSTGQGSPGTTGSSAATGSSGATSSSSGSADGGVPGTLGIPTTSVYDGFRGQSFDGGWKFNRGDVTNGQSTTFNDSSWRTLDLPHDWSIELAFDSNSPGGSNGGFLDGGVGWYRKTFTLDPASSGQRVLIEFDGVYMNSQVWINGTSLGTRPYGYSSFEYDLTPYVNFTGSNVIAVRMDNDQPNSRWYSGSGIYRHVWLTRLNPVHVPYSGVFVSTPSVTPTSATVAVSTDVQNQSATTASATVTTTLLDPGGATVTSADSAATSVAAAATSTISQTLTVASPRLWSTTSPNLYQVKVEIKVGGVTQDTYRTSLGVRTATFDPNRGFSLNGQNMKLQGVCLHHDLGALGTAVNYRAIERELRIMKDMGANAIRTSHNPPAPELLDITDRIGLLVMDEAFDTWTQPKTTNDYSVNFTQWAQTDIQDMARRDRNHPSVIMWSIGNEIYSSTTTLATNLRNWVRAEDTTRPVTWASNQMNNTAVQSVAAVLDLQGYNYAGYVGDYDADHAAHPTWNIFGSETTAAVRTRGVYHTPADTLTKANSGASPDKQCSSYDNETTNFGNSAEGSYTLDNDRPFVAGSFVWSGFDYIGEPTPYSSYPSKSSYFGIVDTAGFPKDVYYFYKSRWTANPVIHLLPHWNWTTGTTVTVFVYNNCDAVELFLNDASQGMKTMAAGTLHSEWNVPWASGTLRAECRRGGSVVATDQVVTAGTAARVALSADRGTIAADGRDLVYVTGDIQDANRVFVPTGDNSVAFSVSGPGQIVGVDNGNPLDTASYKGTTRKAFSGKVLAIVRSTGTAGAITVTASSSGLTSTPVTVTAQ
jgi:beta-galactosidase